MNKEDLWNCICSKETTTNATLTVPWTYHILFGEETTVDTLTYGVFFKSTCCFHLQGSIIDECFLNGYCSPYNKFDFF